jgi:hypothetical protein
MGSRALAFACEGKTMKTDREVALKAQVGTIVKIAQGLLIEANCIGLWNDENHERMKRIIEDLETIRRELRT